MVLPDCGEDGRDGSDEDGGDILGSQVDVPGVSPQLIQLGIPSTVLLLSQHSSVANILSQSW